MEEMVKNELLGEQVLVTGASGLVGSWLVKKLISRGALVTALVMDIEKDSELVQSGDIDLVNIVYGNLSSRKDLTHAVMKSECTTVFHLGAQTIVGTALKDPLGTFQSNIQGTWNLLEAIKMGNGQVKSVVVASSDKAYGESKNLPYTEETPLNARSPYDVSKACTDLIAQSYAHTYSLPIGIARCGNIFGGGDTNWSRLIPGTIRALLQGSRPMLRSNGTPLRDYIYVKDVVDSYIELALYVKKGNASGEAFNLSTGNCYSVMELYNEISKLVTGNIIEPKILNNAFNEIQAQNLDSSKAKLQFGWESKYSLQEGLAETIMWYRKLFK
jgi:CDP-glucose 4,6-dehydratase